MTTSANDNTANWVSKRHLQHIAARGEAAGVDVEALLAEVGLDSTRLAGAGERIPLSSLENLLTAFARRHGIAMLGLQLAGDIQPASFGTLGHLALACNSFGEVLEEATRYNGLLSNIGETVVSHGPGTVAIGWVCRAGSEAFQREATEYVLGAMARLARFLMPEQGDFILKVMFEHARPQDPELSRSYFQFFRAPVAFDQPSSAIVIRADMLATRMRHGDERLRELLELHADRQLQQNRQDASLHDDVRHLIEALMAEGNPTRDAVARQLGLSARTLHRRLQAQGSSYRQLLDCARLQRADKLLCRERATVADTAKRLGFSGHQAFVRWFKQQTGATPHAYRVANRPSCRFVDQ